MSSGQHISDVRIVVGVDGSPQSQQALRWSAHLAVTFGRSWTS